ncbi:MAG: amidohydrolase family protein [Gammaproteobacteria bacterium]|nr:amidohydrolase family protein [Gammaproteobacteria bacterium]
MTQFDTLIKNGTVIDGTGLPGFKGDIGIRNGRIAKMGRIDVKDAREVINAEGLIVAPGFIDLHTHYDAQIHWDPYCTISGWHGVTSVAIGNCGFGFAPAHPQNRERLLQMMTRTEQIPYESMVEGMGLDWEWETLPEWMDHLDGIPKGVNLLSYVPLNPLLVYVLGLEGAKAGRAATPDELGEMKRLLGEAMDAGMMGFSVQRFGEHSLQADFDGTPMPTDIMPDETLLAFSDLLGERGEGFIQILNATNGEPLKSKSDADQKFVEELARRSGRPILYNALVALDAAGNENVHLEALKWIDSCFARGLRVFGQAVTVRAPFQFTLEDWNLYDSSPAWNYATQGTVEERTAKLSDPAVRKQMIDEEEMLVTTGVGGPIEGLTIQETPDHPELEQYVGRKIGEIAQAEDKHPIEAMLDIGVAGELKVLYRTQEVASIDPKKVGELIRNQHVLPGISDGGAHTKFFTGGSFTTDLIAWLVRETGELTLEQAHYRLSYLPAQAAGFTDRGFLREGAPADIVVYDFENLRRVPEVDYEIAHDFPANQWRRIQRAEGYRWILVNGVVTFKDGECTGATPGRLLRLNRLGEQETGARAAA